MERDFYQEVYDHIMHDCASDMYQWNRKGIINVDDESNQMLASIKERLRYDDLNKAGKVCELTIDESWTSFIKESANNDTGRKCWNKLVAAAYKANHGLLVLNVSNIKLFSRCWHLKQLAKQEVALQGWYPYDNDFESFHIEPPYKFMFDGYVLITIKGFKWKDAVDYAYKHLEYGQIQAMMSFYRLAR